MIPNEAPSDAVPRPSPQDDGKGDANWALGLAIASVVFCAPLTAPLALWKAIRSTRTRPYARATAAIVLAVFGLLTSAFFWFLAVWQYLSPESPRAH
ncbi:MAG: hypothetical protein HY898_15155 [Deltaproteobacteria bacterium]|nr:hypothetical protein [Deltaproteobacteria bacterium]